jgi:hypothetical protein
MYVVSTTTTKWDDDDDDDDDDDGTRRRCGTRRDAKRPPPPRTDQACVARRNIGIIIIAGFVHIGGGSSGHQSPMRFLPEPRALMRDGVGMFGRRPTVREFYSRRDRSSHPGDRSAVCRDAYRPRGRRRFAGACRLHVRRQSSIGAPTKEDGPRRIKPKQEATG